MSSKNLIPPKLARRFLRWFLRDDLTEEVEGDLEEQYVSRVREESLLKARLTYWYEVLRYFRPFAIRTLWKFNHTTMIRNHLKISWRTLLKNKGYSSINIGGLSLGMAVALLLGLWVYDELTFNRHFENYHRIVQVMQNQTFNGKVETWWSQAKEIAPALRANYPDDFEYVCMASWNWDHKLTFGDRSIKMKGNYMEPQVTEMLSLNMLQGARDALDDPYSIILSSSTAKAVFGTEDPMNKVIRLDDEVDVIVTGIYEDLPFNSSFASLKLIIPWGLYVTTQNLQQRTSWGNSWFQCLAQVADHADIRVVSEKIRDVKLNAVAQSENSADDARFNPVIFLFPMSSWHLRSEFTNGRSTGGRIQYVWLFGVVGIFVLLLACINFMNLSTARSEKRSMEVGIRKVMGSPRMQLVNQFFSESFMVALFAFLLALLLVLLAISGFNTLADKQISIPWMAPAFWLVSLGFVLFTGLLAGSYPAVFLSSFLPIKVLKGGKKAGRAASRPRQVLVVFQFTVSVVLIVGTIVVFQQINHARNRPIGYNNNGLISSPIQSDLIRDHFDAFRQELLNTGVVENVAASESPITSINITNSGFYWQGKDPDMSEEFWTSSITHEFGETIGWEIEKGRDFSTKFTTDTAGFIINQTAAEYMGLSDPVGEVVRWGNNGEWTIIGVVDDLITRSPYEPVQQMIFFLRSKRNAFNVYRNVLVKLRQDVPLQDALVKVGDVFNKYDPENPFEYSFADDDYAQKFANEMRLGKMAFIFAGLAILISCLGLFGLIAYVAERRTKEIGIRKVLGASIISVWQMLSRDFVLLVTISSVLAIPLAYLIMSNWLENFPYRTTLSWWIFVASIAGAVLLTLLTVSFQVIKAARVNPVTTLRSE